MGMVHADIELVNGDDLAFARKHIIGDDEIKRIRVRALVDSGAYMLCINENIQAVLQLPVVDKKSFQLTNGIVVHNDVVAPVELRFRNRRTICRAIVLPGDSEPLLGAIPMEDMDVLIDPLRRELIVNPAHPDYARTRL